MTKKEMKIIENEKREKASLRRQMMDDLNSYWRDIEAVTRVAKINGEKEKLDYSGYLVKEEQEKLFNRYENLKDLSKNQNDVLRILLRNDEDRRTMMMNPNRTLMKEK